MYNTEKILVFLGTARSLRKMQKLSLTQLSRANPIRYKSFIEDNILQKFFTYTNSNCYYLVFFPKELKQKIRKIFTNKLNKKMVLYWDQSINLERKSAYWIFTWYNIFAEENLVSYERRSLQKFYSKNNLND